MKPVTKSLDQSELVELEIEDFADQDIIDQVNDVTDRVEAIIWESTTMPIYVQTRIDLGLDI